MGLELYVGSLTRYFCCNWETALQKSARRKGTYLKVELDEKRKEDAPPTRDEIEPQVVEFKRTINDGIKNCAAQPIDWDESIESPYFTDLLYFQGHSSLMLWAAYLENPDLQRPKECIEDFVEDEAYTRCSDMESKTEFANLLKNTVCWLPGDFPGVVEETDLCGSELVYGSSIQLFEELNQLNNRTWKADKATIERWRRLGLGKSCTLEEAAKYAISVFIPLTERAIKHKLVMRLDW